MEGGVGSLADGLDVKERCGTSDGLLVGSVDSLEGEDVVVAAVGLFVGLLAELLVGLNVKDKPVTLPTSGSVGACSWNLFSDPSCPAARSTRKQSATAKRAVGNEGPFIFRRSVLCCRCSAKDRTANVDKTNSAVGYCRDH